MSNLAIKVDNLSKLYKIGARKQRHNTLRDQVAYGLKSLFIRKGRGGLHSGERSTRSAFQPSSDGYIWALKDVSFEIARGEVVGIIGSNGAGKSTLLKILSRITHPTEGHAEMYGRIGSLLEVGTGFHPELTGRENIYLNGAILGMRKGEINSKFDEIVEFSGVEKFLDTPVKHYSSGMYVRLAFAVAAHLEPEILIVDEVLAVGDAAFQTKCLDKMQDSGRQGRTVLLVSHNMAAISRLCPRAILLNGGTILKDAPSSQVVSTYFNAGLGRTASRVWSDPETAPSGKVARLRAVRVCTEDDQITDTVDIRRPVKVEMEYEVATSGHVLAPYVQFHAEEGTTVFEAIDLDPCWRGRPRPPGHWVSIATVPGNLLSEGVLSVSVGIVAIDPFIKQLFVRNAVAFQVIDNLEGDSARGDWNGSFAGLVRPLLKWNTRFNPVNGDLAKPASKKAAI
jgi:lipopolysaccharide transport system ATP-binding protein